MTSSDATPSPRATASGSADRPIAAADRPASSIRVEPTVGAATRVYRAALRTYWSRLLLSGILVLGTWELIGRTVLADSLFFEPISLVLLELVRLFTSGVIWIHLYTSMAALVLGFVGGSLVGVAVGVLMGASRSAYGLLSPWVALLYASPLIAVTPLFILAFGVGIASKVALVFVVSMFPVIVNTAAGFRSAEQRYLEMAASFNASRGQVVRKILMPSALPFIMSGMRLASGRAVVGVVVGEFFVARAGLGYLIATAAQVFRMDRLFAGVILFAIIGLGLFSLFEWLERRLAPWRVTTPGGGS